MKEICLFGAKFDHRPTKNDLMQPHLYEFYGLVMLEDTIRPDVSQTVMDFHSAGMKIWILTGDSSEVTKHVAGSTGIAKNIVEIEGDLQECRVAAESLFSSQTFVIDAQVIRPLSNKLSTTDGHRHRID